ncbi:MAG: universal stress protein [Haloarculaceae archaeon]
MFETILVPTDGSDGAAAAMRQAIDLAATYDATIDVVHVIDTRHYDLSIDSAREPLARDGERYVSRLVEMATDAGVEAEGFVVDGRPGRAILEFADDHDADLVVMGARGRGGLERLLGSTTDYVSKHARIPVQLAPHSDGE